jgi:hypothetical protein
MLWSKLVKKWRKWAFPLIVIGMNSIAAYFLADYFGRQVAGEPKLITLTPKPIPSVTMPTLTPTASHSRILEFGNFRGCDSSRAILGDFHD